MSENREIERNILLLTLHLTFNTPSTSVRGAAVNLTLAPLPADSQNLYAIRSRYLLAKFQAQIRKIPTLKQTFVH